jgi:hypothetical protein
LQGFAIVRKSGSLQLAKPRFEFRCVHHSNKTANTCQLEDHVERDENDIITSRQKQENTIINACSCLYLVVLSRKQLGQHRSSLFRLILGVLDDTYSYLIIVNLLRYKKEYIKVLLSFLLALELNKSLYLANITYSIALRVLK